MLERSGTGPADASPDRDADLGDAGDRDAGAPPDAARPDGGPVLAVPGPPGMPTFTDLGPDSARVDWTPPTSGGPVERYVLERAPDLRGAPDTFVAIARDLATPGADDRGLVTGETYWYRVQGFNAAGGGPYSPTATLTAGPPPPPRRVQSAVAEGVDPTARFGAPPREGNLLVAVVFMRLEDATPDIAGWDRLVYSYYRTNDGNRRGLALFGRVAGPAEPTDVRVTWSEARECHLLVQEIAAGPVTWAFVEAAANDSGNSTVRSLEVSASAVVAGESLVIGAFGSRDDPGGSVSFDGLMDAIGQGGDRALATAYASGVGIPPATTARWPADRRVTVALAVYRVDR